MLIEKFLRTIRSPFGGKAREEISLEDEVTLYRRRADVALQEERWSDALVFLAKVLRLNPYDLQSRMLVAETYHYALNEPTKALLTYEKVVAAAGYDESNEFCAKAHEGIRDLTAVFAVAPLPLGNLLDEDFPSDSSHSLDKKAAI